MRGTAESVWSKNLDHGCLNSDVTRSHTLLCMHEPGRSHRFPSSGKVSTELGLQLTKASMANKPVSCKI